jgi:uncharacterized membrane protein
MDQFFFFIMVMEHSGNHPKKAQKGFSIETQVREGTNFKTISKCFYT